MKINKEMQEKIQELQILEQNLQNLLLQKQAFQMELNETELALRELEQAKGDSYKIIGQIMIKTDKKDLSKELEEKKKIIELRINAIEKQEAILTEKLAKSRQEIQSKIK